MKEILDLKDFATPWRRIAKALPILFLVLAWAYPKDASVAVLAWARDQGCRVEQTMASAFANSHVLRMSVVPGTNGCVVHVTPQPVVLTPKH